MSSDQLPLLDGDISWVAVFRSLFQSGDAARMGVSAFAVYVCVKCFVNWKTGLAFPSIATIAEQTGLSARTVVTSLQKLEEMGYLKKTKEWKKNVYTLVEKFEFKDEEGKTVAQATFDYLPALIRQATTELKHFKVTGEATNFNVIHIEKFTIENPIVVMGDMHVHTQELANIKDEHLRNRLKDMISQLTKDKKV